MHDIGFIRDNPDAFDRALERTGVPLTDLYRRRSEFEPLHELAEVLADYDERLRLWRFRHYSVVARAIGEELADDLERGTWQRLAPGDPGRSHR